MVRINAASFLSLTSRVNNIDVPGEQEHSANAPLFNFNPDMITPENNEQVVNVNEQIENLKQTVSDLEQNNSQRPDMGLLGDNATSAKTDTEKAKEEQSNTENQVQTDNEQAQENLDNTTQEAEQNNNNAENKLNSAQQNLSDKQSAVQNAQSQVDTAQAELTSAQSQLSCATTDEEKASAQKLVQEAEQKVNLAKQELERCNKELEQAQKEVEEAQANQQQVKEEGEKAVEEANNKLETQKTEGEEKIKEAQSKTETAQKNQQAAEEEYNESEKIIQEIREKHQKAQKEINDISATIDGMSNGYLSQIKLDENGNPVTYTAEVDGETVELNDYEEIPVKYNKRKYNETLNAINKDNISELSPSTVRSIASNENRSEAQRQKDLDNVYNTYIERARELGVSDEELRDIENRCKNNYGVTCFDVNNTDATDYMASQLQNAIKKQEFNNWKTNELQRIEKLRDNPNDIRTSMQRAAEEQFIKEGGNTISQRDWENIIEFGHILKVSDDALDGKISAGSTDQKTGNCWLFGGLDSMLSTDMGRKIVEQNIYYDELHGTVAVQIPESNNNNLGLYREGIYTYGEQQLYKSSFARGDYDAIALNNAISEYFEELSEQKNDPVYGIYGDHPSLKGNSATRFYELMTGNQTQIITDSNSEIPLGISYAYRKNLDFDKIYELVKSGKGSVTLDEIIVDAYNSNNSGQHAFSVVGVEGDKLVLHDSNNSSYIAKTHFNDYEEKDGIYYLKISREEFYEWVINAGIIRYQ